MTGDLLYLSHMRECIARIEQFTSGDRQRFMGDIMVQDAVLRNLHTLSESSTHVSSTLREANPGLPWKEMRGFRNIVVHDYLGLDLDQVWGILENDLPSLKQGIERMLGQLG